MRRTWPGLFTAVKNLEQVLRDRRPTAAVGLRLCTLARVGAAAVARCVRTSRARAVKWPRGAKRYAPHSQDTEEVRSTRRGTVLA